MRKRKFSLIFIILFTGLIFSYFFICNVLPTNLSIIKDHESNISLKLPFNVYIRGENNGGEENQPVLKINGRSISNKYIKFNTDSPLTVSAGKTGQVSLDFRLFGIIPLKTLKINVLPEIRVYPGGQAIGVLLRSKGVMVVGNSYVESSDGHKYYPAREAGINVGDRILSINGRKVNDKIKLSSYIQEYASDGSELKLKLLKKNGHQKKVILQPIKNRQGIYMIGLYVDDGVAGVGTLTFYREKTGEFGALGHLITESRSQTRVDIRKGTIVEANISGISSGQKGLPGEKLGTFFQTKDILGEVIKNNQFGIYGQLSRSPDVENEFFKEPIPIATSNHVRTGPAKIYTVINGGKIEEFDIQIDRVYRQSYPAGKGMILNIIDPDLKRMTGGIVQGMSGSPIVQDGRLVGAVTHVFVNNPCRGYGVFAEWMVLQTNSLKKAS